MTALDVVTDGECPDRYRFPICTLYFPEALLSPSILHLKIQLVAASMKYLIQVTLYERP